MGDEGEGGRKGGSQVPEWMAQPCVKRKFSKRPGSDREFMTDVMLSLQVEMPAEKVGRVPALTPLTGQLCCCLSARFVFCTNSFGENRVITTKNNKQH